jgi:hypothetical protein
LDGATLNGVQIGDITFVHIEDGMKRPKQRDGIAHAVRDEPGFERRISGALSRLRMHRDSTSKIQDGYDLHG